MKILFISRKGTQCGVNDYGKRINSILCNHMDIEFCEIDTPEDYNRVFELSKPDVVLYNYHYATLPFITNEFISPKRNIKHVAIYHEANLNFTPDEIISTSVRPLFEDIELETVVNDIPTIGSFGFGFPDKNYTRIAELVKSQLNVAKIRLNIPFAEYGDRDGTLARREAERVRARLQGTNITLEVNHDFLSQTDLLKFLRGNDINLFLFDQSTGRGLSSSTDYALSVCRPIGISGSEMFRHLPKELNVDNTSIKALMANWFNILQPVYEENSNAKLIEKYKVTLLNGKA